ncbi:MAG TPA: glutamate synthase central domain-containing protein, partial [Chloroflexota bacterium]|nr:glutamate synthase central domain-containing protein [Chloroflexota bacterium]
MPDHPSFPFTPAGLYDPRFEHDACGVGFVARLSGQPAHDIVAKAVEAVANLSHRGAVAADGKSGDGSGVLTQVPRKLFVGEIERLGLGRVDDGDLLGVGMVFLPADGGENVVECALSEQGLTLLGWRDVPLDPEQLGEGARSTLPRIRQAIIVPQVNNAEQFEAGLYLARKSMERRAEADDLYARGFYVASLSCRTLVYKGLFAAHQLPAFYKDLRDSNYESALAVYHQRYSTNTFPTWQLAQPFRLLAHNGEINTLLGNRAWMRAREAALPPGVRPVIWEAGSDSTSLDEALHLLERSGRNVLHALSVLMPPAWEGNAQMTADEQAFYRYHAPTIEPWDGPAALAFSDGRYVGAALDRNGLRPCRYKVTAEGLVVAGSEVGAIELDDYRIVEKGRLGPGQMLALDLERHEILHDADIKRELGRDRPWKSWLSVVPLDQAEQRTFVDTRHVPVLQRALGYSNEDVKIVLRTMGAEAQDAVWSMGDDTPIAPFARVPRPIYTFFRQRFAQVTNPPIDPLRETLVMSLRTWLGPQPDLLRIDGAQPDLIELESPVIDEHTLAAIRAQTALRVVELDAAFDPEEGSAGLQPALERLADVAEQRTRGGAQLLVLSDRRVGPDCAAMPMLLALSAVHQRLLATGLRTRVDLVVEAGDAWDVHHIAVLLGYGAGAVCPWLALRTARVLAEDERPREPRIGNGHERTSLHNAPTDYPDPVTAEHNYRKAADKGLLKIMSKMGISTSASYRGGQIFECLGLSQSVVDRYFAGTPNRIGGLRIEDLARPILDRHRLAFGSDSPDRLPDYGLVRFRRDGERHAWEPPVVRALHKGLENGAPETWQEYYRLTDMAEQPNTLRDLLEIQPAGPPVPLDDVEPATEIATRFVCTAMSLGALSPEAHETLAVAMNRIRARSNSGEGGEDPAFYAPRANGDRADNKIKQVASGRFGVTTEYLVYADDIQIKMAQGAKPGEGGQLPGNKVWP